MPLKFASPPALRGRLLGLAVGVYLALGLHGAASVGSAAGTATAAVTLVLLTALALACRARGDAAVSRDPRRVRVAIRARIGRTAFLPQRDPDASGRPRPRAPGH